MSVLQSVSQKWNWWNGTIKVCVKVAQIRKCARNKYSPLQKNKQITRFWRNNNKTVKFTGYNVCWFCGHEISLKGMIRCRRTIEIDENLLNGFMFSDWISLHTLGYIVRIWANKFPRVFVEQSVTIKKLRSGSHY